MLSDRLSRIFNKTKHFVFTIFPTSEQKTTDSSPTGQPRGRPGLIVSLSLFAITVAVCFAAWIYKAKAKKEADQQDPVGDNVPESITL